MLQRQYIKLTEFELDKKLSIFVPHVSSSKGYRRESDMKSHVFTYTVPLKKLIVFFSSEMNKSTSGTEEEKEKEKLIKIKKIVDDKLAKFVYLLKL